MNDIWSAKAAIFNSFVIDRKFKFNKLKRIWIFMLIGLQFLSLKRKWMFFGFFVELGIEQGFFWDI